MPPGNNARCHRSTPAWCAAGSSARTCVRTSGSHSLKGCPTNPTRPARSITLCEGGPDSEGCTEPGPGSSSVLGASKSGRDFPASIGMHEKTKTKLAFLTAVGPPPTHDFTEYPRPIIRSYVRYPTRARSSEDLAPPVRVGVLLPDGRDRRFCRIKPVPVMEPQPSCARRSRRSVPNLAARPRSGHICGRNRGTMMEGHLSVATIAALSKILRTCRNLRHVIGREPTAEEIAGRLRMPPETIRKLLGAPPPPRRH